MKKLYSIAFLLFTIASFSQGGYTPFAKLRLTTPPVENNTAKQILVRDEATGNVNYLSKDSIKEIQQDLNSVLHQGGYAQEGGNIVLMDILNQEIPTTGFINVYPSLDRKNTMGLESGAFVSTSQKLSDPSQNTYLHVGGNDNNILNIKAGSSVPNFQGIVYSQDFSADYTPRSLVDKEYVDSVAGGGNFIPLSGTAPDEPITGDLEILDKQIIFETTEGYSLKLKGNSLGSGRTIELLNPLGNIAFKVDAGGASQGESIVGAGNDSNFTFRTSGGTDIKANSVVTYNNTVTETFSGRQLPDADWVAKSIGFIKSNENLSGAKRNGNILYGILDQYTGEEITLSKITSIPTGNSVDNIIYFQLGSDLFKRVFTQYNIQWFGALPNDNVDDTPQIQSCINSCFYAGGGTILTPHGIYTIAGPLVTSDNKGNNPNSQLYIPGKRDLAVGGTDTAISIKFIGSETPTMNASGFVDDKIAEINQGCIWQSTLSLSQATGVLPSVIGSKGDNPTYNFNVIDVMFEDMWIRTHHDATVGTYMTAFNMLDVAFSTFERCRADIDVAGFNSVEHQNLSIGIAPTKSNGGTTVVANNCTSYGYKIGYTVGEHAYYTNLNANFCVYAYDVSKAGHASMIVKALTQWNKHAMSFNMYDNEYGDLDPLYIPANFIAINEFVVEAINNGKWYVSTVDIVDPTNGIKGNCFFTKTVSGQGVFANTKLIKNGGLNLNDKHITRPIAVFEEEQSQRTYFKLRNPYPTGPASFAAFDTYGGPEITESTKFQIGQVSDGTAAINNLANKPLIITVNNKSLTLSPNGDASLEGKLSILNATASNHAVALGQLSSTNVSSATTLSLSATEFSSFYTFTGTTSTYTLPTIASSTGKRIIIINAGTGSITLNSNTGGADIWEGGTNTATTSIMSTLTLTLYCDGLKWRIIE